MDKNTKEILLKMRRKRFGSVREKIKNAKSDDEIDEILLKLYDEGYEDGLEESDNDYEYDREPAFDWRDLD